ncbi:LamG domain-containing protein [Leptolyngbya sp. 7M]|uniref:LamG domain-containing protein n=1 Tax=Leptolyngbya sp. 7M TaxID=2812896 RepID=UPI001B8D894B|nr:LamG domain-containing protein [Leptolyngbya sp. 7M]QYO64645.1 LamG domain-containing protein [Leptolyngbya sp. 7M]
MDPLALQESWFRLQHPVAEPPAERLQSVIAAQPDSPARLSRLAALKQNIASYRQAVPPRPTNHSGSQPPEPAQAIKTERLRHTGLPILDLPQEGALPADLQVLYLFQGGSGRRVMDRSGVGEPLDLDLMERSGGQEPPWRWEGDGLRLLRSSILIANRPATKLINACRSTQELTIEVWLELDADQTMAIRLAPIVTLSNDPNNRYFTLAQGGRDNQSGGDLFSVRLRTDSTTHSDGTRSAAGTPLDRTAPIATHPGSAKAGLSHIVFTRQANGLMKVYIDGQERASNTLLNSLFPVYRGQNSDQTFRLGLGNEILGNSPWLGKYYRVAIYSRALTIAEVQSQFSQGYLVWAPSGVQIATSQLAQSPPTLSRYAAATLLPTASPSAHLQAQNLAIRSHGDQCPVC